MKAYWRFILLDLKSQMQYKLSFFLTILGQFLTAYTSFFGLYFIFDKVGAIDGFTYEQVLLCFAVVMLAFSIGELFGGGLASFASVLGDGRFDRALVRPRSPMTQIVMANMDFTRLGLLLQALLVMGIAIPQSGILWSADKILALTLMVGCGSALFFGLFLLKATFSFFTTQSLNFLNVFTYGARQFGRYPFSAYGKTVLDVLTYVIPLALFQYYPLLYLLGREQSVWYLLLPIVGLLFLLPCYGLYRFGLSKYKSTGS